MTAVEMIAVDSSHIAGIGYNTTAKALFVRFKSKPGRPPSRLYRYDGIEPEEFEAFRNAESIGSYFNAHFKWRPFAIADDSTGDPAAG